MQFINSVLRGGGQVFLQENRWTGLLFLMGLTIGNWRYGLAALLASVVGTAFACLLRYDKKEIEAGLYGFSATLVGIVLLFLFEPTALIWGLVILGAVLACLLQHFFIRIALPAFTFPFILMAWGFIFCLSYLYGHASSSLLFSDDDTSISFPFLLWGTKGYGQVMFQSNIYSGIFFLAGVAVHSRIAAIYGLVGAFIASFLAMCAGQDMASINDGIFGFNAVLSAIVFAGGGVKAALWAFTAVIFTLLIQIILLETVILTMVGGVLTFTFVAGTWVTLLLQKCSSLLSKPMVRV
jgi:urea transporter